MKRTLCLVHVEHEGSSFAIWVTSGRWKSECYWSRFLGVPECRDPTVVPNLNLKKTPWRSNSYRSPSWTMTWTLASHPWTLWITSLCWSQPKVSLFWPFLQWMTSSTGWIPANLNPWSTTTQTLLIILTKIFWSNLVNSSQSDCLTLVKS